MANYINYRNFFVSSPTTSKSSETPSWQERAAKSLREMFFDQQPIKERSAYCNGLSQLLLDVQRGGICIEGTLEEDTSLHFKKYLLKELKKSMSKDLSTTPITPRELLLSPLLMDTKSSLCMLLSSERLQNPDNLSEEELKNIFSEIATILGNKSENHNRQYGNETTGRNLLLEYFEAYLMDENNFRNKAFAFTREELLSLNKSYTQDAGSVGALMILQITEENNKESCKHVNGVIQTSSQAKSSYTIKPCVEKQKTKLYKKSNNFYVSGTCSDLPLSLLDSLNSDQQITTNLGQLRYTVQLTHEAYKGKTEGEKPAHLQIIDISFVPEKEKEKDSIAKEIRKEISKILCGFISSLLAHIRPQPATYDPRFRCF